jgi:hypothetical protein
VQQDARRARGVGFSISHGASCVDGRAAPKGNPCADARDGSKRAIDRPGSPLRSVRTVGGTASVRELDRESKDWSSIARGAGAAPCECSRPALASFLFAAPRDVARAFVESKFQRGEPQ